MIFSKTKYIQLNNNNFICLNNVRNIVSNSFKVQDPKDFADRVLNNDKPVIVDFFAKWCKPCQLLGPRIESVIDEKKGEVLLAKVDIDENSDIALDYEVNAVPVLLGFKKGKAEERMIGLQDEDKLKTFVNKFIEK
ncbi:hypothetical protein PGB90_005957 [Kerria lacca]